ncbi:MAG TPA: hypothetical protein VE871_14715 [Longimicrobium sp.]|nr:hypothetical protein [Longimicrobium sp.]
MAAVHDWGTVALVRIRRLPRGAAALPWHVHEGTCATRGAVVGPLASYSPLRPAGGETVDGEAVLGGVWLDPDRRYTIDVHRGPDDTGPPLACVELTLRT